MAQKPRNGRAGCPDEETLASYLAGGLTPTTSEEMETHLAQCTACLDELSAAHSSILGDEKETVPEALIAKAMALVPQAAQEEGFFDMVVRLARGSLELVSTTGQLVEVPGLAGVRGKLETPGTTILQVEKEMGRFKVAVEVEPVEDELCQLAVTVRAGERCPPMGSASVSWPVAASKPLTWPARGRRSLTGFLPETTASRSLKLTHPWDRYG